jgi:hypothetical protein
VLPTQVVKQLQQMLAESCARVHCLEIEKCTKEAEHAQQLSAQKLWAETEKAGEEEEHARAVEAGGGAEAGCHPYVRRSALGVRWP